MSAPRPLIVVSDVHLSHGGSRATASALSRLIREHAGHEVVLSGDVFNLSCDEAGRDPTESVLDMLRPHDELRQALRQHLVLGSPVTFLAGNHDAAIMRAELRPALLSWLELDLAAPFSNLPWFIRRGGVHIEHGHVYDPDNAPSHPLWYGGPETEPLGVA
ncbi:MAG TPA: metallophosphoesterase, partial [Polyangiaceae bacterium]|nr:metallophosphoesterase [Polyangiaceae bacterium]